MSYVYRLRSEGQSGQTYIGFTEDLRTRLADHYAGRSRHTAKSRPWRIECYVAFKDESVARSFEAYLKTSSGAAFAKKRLRNTGSVADSSNSD